MRTLFYVPLCPFGRKVRMALAERKLDYQGVVENTWKQREEFLELNPLGQAPVLVDLNNQIICDSTVICEYIDEAYSDRSYIGQDALQRAETRRLVAWFDGKFYQQVTHRLVYEKVLKKYFKQQGPDAAVIREGNTNLHHYMGYFSWLIERRHWLAGDEFSLADITAVAHMSCIDYVGHISWERYPDIKEWYGRVKSRPSMRAILLDIVPGMNPPDHYRNLDF